MPDLKPNLKFKYHFKKTKIKLLVQDAEKTLRSLKSCNQPMVKKRQLMQSAFGDYRKKMAEEEKKLRAGMCPHSDFSPINC